MPSLWAVLQAFWSASAGFRPHGAAGCRRSSALLFFTALLCPPSPPTAWQYSSAPPPARSWSRCTLRWARWARWASAPSTRCSSCPSPCRPRPRLRWVGALDGGRKADGLEWGRQVDLSRACQLCRHTCGTPLSSSRQAQRRAVQQHLEHHGGDGSAGGGGVVVALGASLRAVRILMRSPLFKRLTLCMMLTGVSERAGRRAVVGPSSGPKLRVCGSCKRRRRCRPPSATLLTPPLPVPPASTLFRWCLRAFRTC